MSGIDAHARRVEAQLAREERVQRSTPAPRRYPCPTPGCCGTAGQKHRACIACNRRRGQSGSFTREES